jgi:asparagine N-glycosylation enzyme membrane subunit Stt3
MAYLWYCLIISGFYMFFYSAILQLRGKKRMFGRPRDEALSEAPILIIFYRLYQLSMFAYFVSFFILIFKHPPA